MAITCQLFIPANIYTQPNDSLELHEINNRIETLIKKIDDDRHKELYDTSKDSMDLASKIVDWTALFLAALTMIFLIASIIGFRELSEIRKLRTQMVELSERMQNELSEVQMIKNEVNDDIEEVKVRIENESSTFLKTVYLLNEGISNYHEGRLSDAQRKFIEILKINKKDYNATCYLARTYFDQNQYDQALKTITNAIELNDRPHHAYYIMGENYRRIGDYQSSIPAFEKSIELDQRPATYTSMGYTFLKMGDYEKAIESFRNSIMLKRYSTPVCGLAKALLKNGQYEKASLYFNEAVLLAEEELQAGSKYVWPIYNAAFGYLFNNKKRKCQSMLRKAFAKNTNPEVVKEQLSDYKLMLNEKIPEELLNYCIDLLEKRHHEIK